MPNLKREKVTHLGVGVAPAGPSLAAQLGLAPNTGLVVNEVAPESPAQERIKAHDVLVELDGQLLINPEQFAVLIRNHRAGDEVTLKLIRNGKPETLKVKLTTHEAPVMPPGQIGRGPLGDRPRVVFPGGIPAPGQPHFMERQIEVNRRNAPGDEGVVRQRRFVIRDQAGSIEVNTDERGRSVVVKGVDGETVFSGPLNSPADYAAVPEAIRPRLEKLPQGRGPMGPPGRE